MNTSKGILSILFLALLPFFLAFMPLTEDWVSGYYTGFGDATAMVAKAMDFMDAKERQTGVKWPVEEYKMVLRSALDNLGDPRGRQRVNKLLEERE